MFEGVVDWREDLRSDPPEIELLRQKKRTGNPYGRGGFVREAERFTGRRLGLLSLGRL